MVQAGAVHEVVCARSTRDVRISWHDISASNKYIVAWLVVMFDRKKKNVTALNAIANSLAQL